MREIPLTRGKVALVDDADYQMLTEHRWHSSAYGYAIRFVGRDVVRMHRVILSVPPGVSVDHINRDRADNRRENLRPASHRQNCRNRLTHKTMGVGFHKASGKWRADIKVDYQQISLGLFKTQAEAMEARIRAEAIHFGEFAPKRD